MATVELRVLLLEWLDETARLCPLVSLTIYVDDISVEAVASVESVRRVVVEAVERIFACCSCGLSFRPRRTCVALRRRAWHMILWVPSLSLKLLACCGQLHSDAASVPGGGVTLWSVKNALLLFGFGGVAFFV